MFKVMEAKFIAGSKEAIIRQVASKAKKPQARAEADKLNRKHDLAGEGVIVNYFVKED